MRRARIVVPLGLELAPGDTIRGPVRFYEVPGPVVPDGFDTQFHAYFDGIGAYGNSHPAGRPWCSGDPASPAHVIDNGPPRHRRSHQEALWATCGRHRRSRSSPATSPVSPTMRGRSWPTSGLAHVLSVSGLHLTIVAGGVFVASCGCSCVSSPG
jgi:competence protein ComEC